MPTQKFAVRSPADLARTISEGRLVRGLTQQELANETGMDRSYLSRLEGGLATVQLDRIFVALRVLGVSVEASMEFADG